MNKFSTRGTRWLIVLALLVVIGGSGYFYILDQRFAKQHRTAPPPMLPADTNATAIDYEWAQSSGGFASVEVKAKTFRQVRDTPNYELGGLELRLNQKDHEHYDLIKSSSAQFNKDEGHMYSDGEVEITLDIPIHSKPLHKLTSIKTSGVSFDSKSGNAVTQRPTQFTFENGEGKCTGATYDPTTHELHLLNNPVMNMRGTGPRSKPMIVQGGEITYKEVGAVIYLTPWSKMMRAETTIDAGPSVVNLKDGKVEAIDAQKATGVDKYPKREVRYSADLLHVSYNDDGEINKITGTGNAKMHEESQGGATDLRSNVAYLDFISRDNESVLQHVLADGDAVADSKPGPDASGKLAESRTLKSNTIEINMRPDGREIDQMKTHAPGTLEFFPNAPDQHHRLLTGERMTIGYAPNNVLKDYRVVSVQTLTYPAANNKTKNAAPSKTASADLYATFDAHGQLATMKQWGNFTYEEGERRAKSVTATLDQQNNTMDLENGSRIWDANGSTNADKIHLIQKTGDYVADGHVMTSRLPDQDSKPGPDGKPVPDAKKDKKSGDMLDGDEPIQGTAPHMTSANHNKLVHYENGAVLWQGSDRIEAQAIEIDREKHIMSATGKVITQILDEAKDNDKNGNKDKDKDKPGPPSSQSATITKVSVEKAPLDTPKPPSSPVYTVVTADKMIYTDTDRLAHYSGSVVLNRPGLNVKSVDLLAYLNPKDTTEDTRLNHAIGEGKVEIVDSAPQRHRVGHGEHGEYYSSEDKIILRGNLADLYDSIKKDDSHGAELTYFTSDDRLLIKGATAKPVDSHLHRKPRANANPGNH